MSESLKAAHRTTSRTMRNLSFKKGVKAILAVLLISAMTFCVSCNTENIPEVTTASETAVPEETTASAEIEITKLNLGFTLPEKSNEFSNEMLYLMFEFAATTSADGMRVPFDKYGFSEIVQKNYDKVIFDRSHTSAYTIGSGMLEQNGKTSEVVMISVQGTSAGEWYSNFDFSSSRSNQTEFADNFLAAAQEAVNSIHEYVNAHAIDSPIYAVTGYSRGAACANLIGYILDSEVSSDSVYVYTFATPATVRTREIAECNNIFNIVNTADLVPYVPTAFHGFYRVGRDIEIEGDASYTALVNQLLTEFEKLAPDIESYYNQKHLLLEGQSETTVFEVCNLFCGLLSGNNPGVAESLGSMISGVSPESSFAGVFGVFASVPEPLQIFSQHYPTAYLELLEKKFPRIDNN